MFSVVDSFNGSLYISLDISFELVSEMSKCDDDSKISHEGKISMRECARVCKEKDSVLFVFSRQGLGSWSCEEDRCLCYCYPGVYKNGTCPMKSWSNDDLYRINQNIDAFKGDLFFSETLFSFVPAPWHILVEYSLK